MFRFLETDRRDRKKYERRMQTSVDNTVNDLRYENKFENRVKDKNNFLLSEKLLFFFLKKYILFLERYFFKILNNFFAERY